MNKFLLISILLPLPYAASFSSERQIQDRVAITALSAQAEGIKAKFRDYDRLIESVDAVLKRMARNYSRVTMGTATGIHRDILDGILQPYERLSGDASFGRSIEAIWKQIEERGRSADEALPAEAADLVLAPDRSSFYNILYYLKRRGAFKLLEGLNASVPANVAIENMGAGSPPTYVLDLSAKPAGRARSTADPALQAVANILHGMPGAKEWFYILNDREIFGELRAGDRRANAYAHVNSGDGVVRISYQELGYGFGPEARLRFIAGVLYQNGFSVDVRNGLLNALLDAGAKNVSLDALNRALTAALRGLQSTQGLDKAFVLLAQDGPTDAEFSKHIDRWVSVLTAKNELPFYVYGQPGGTIKGYRDGLEDGSIDAMIFSPAKKIPSGALEAGALKQPASIKLDEVLTWGKPSIEKTCGITFNRDRRGRDHILVSPTAGDPDYLAVLDQFGGLIMAGGRPEDPLANQGVRHGIFTGLIRSSITDLGLPIRLRIGSRWVDALLREGDSVRLNPKSGMLELLPPIMSGRKRRRLP